MADARETVSRSGVILKLVAMAVLAWMTLAPAHVAQAAPAADRLVVETRKGPVEITVELATTPAQRERGLMFRKELAPRHGMLFDFHTEQPVAFWMRNTLIPLDMLFIDGGGRIVYVHPRAVPLALDPIGPEQPVRAVLEIGGGEAAALGIAAGDRVRHPIFEASG